MSRGTLDRSVDGGRHVLVTGALGDIGGAVVIALARRGHHVTATDLADEQVGGSALDAAAAGNGTVRARLAYRRMDVTDRVSVQSVVASVPDLDTVVANAGMVTSAPFLEITPEQWGTHLDVNLTGAFTTAQVTAQRLVAEGRPGLLLFTGSWVAEVPWPEITAYVATKAALQMVARQAARELAPYGIRANVVAPGIVRAGLAKRQLQLEPQYAARAARVVPLGELQTVEQVADAFCYLCSPGADYMTGSTLLIDGGASLFAFD